MPLDFGPETPIPVCPGMWLLRDFVVPSELKTALESVCAAAPLRHMYTPGGHRMSVRMTNCGSLGWVSDRSGYRYSPTDPDTGQHWPRLPSVLRSLAQRAAGAAGYEGFVPDACLINCYIPGSGMTAHQDRNERDFSHPVVSVSLGIAARFFIQGPERRGTSIPVDLASGDVIVWGGESRLFYHGVRPLKEAHDPLFGACRYNLTLRRAG